MITAEVLLEHGFLISTWVWGDRYKLMGWRVDNDKRPGVYVDAVYNTFSGKPNSARANQGEVIVGYEGVIGALRTKFHTVEDLEKWISENVPLYCICVF